MPAQKIRADYDQLHRASKDFRLHGESIQQSLKMIRQVKNALEGGDWVGSGAKAFYREMNSEVLKSLERLMAALKTASHITHRIIRIMQQAEADAAAVFKVEAASPTPGGKSDGVETPPEEVAVLTLGQKVPNQAEQDVVGAASTTIARGTPEFDALVENYNPDIIFKNEDPSSQIKDREIEDRMMTQRLSDKLDNLAELVKKEWPGLKLRVTEAWDETMEHAPNSTHYEGRGADLTVSDMDSAKLGRLAQLAVNAGLDWVWYEDGAHVHVSVKSE